jgi:tRNA splicing endonuclease
MISIPVFFIIVGLIFITERFVNSVIVRAFIVLIIIILSSILSVSLGQRVAETNQLIRISRSISDVLLVIDKYKNHPDELSVVIKFLQDMLGDTYKLKHIELTIMDLDGLDRSLEKGGIGLGVEELLPKENEKESNDEP